MLKAYPDTTVFGKTGAFLMVTRGSKIIAEGIEQQSELDVCIDIGCEFVQGYLIQKPSCHLNDIKTVYPMLTQVA